MLRAVFDLLTIKEDVVYNVVLDLDGTVVKTAFSEPSPADIHVNGVPHRLAFGALELLAALAQRNDVRLSFFSAADAWRNEPLVRELGKRVKALGVTSWRVDVFSSHHLAANGAKDLQQLPSHFDLQHTIIIDDVPGVCPADQERNQLQIVSFEQDHPYEPAQARVRARYSLIRAAGVLACSWQQTKRGRVSWLDAVGSLQWQAVNGEAQQRTMRHDEMLYIKGLELLQPFGHLQIQPDVTETHQVVYPYSAA